MFPGCIVTLTGPLGTAQFILSTSSANWVPIGIFTGVQPEPAGLKRESTVEFWQVSEP
jgi:hypothetical protein